MNAINLPKKVIQGFCSHPDTVVITTLGEGNINDTFLVRSKEKTFVLQRINSQVFPEPQIIIDNLAQLSRHLNSTPASSEQRWEDASLILALDGATSIHDDEGNLWRALSYIADSICFSRAETSLQAEQTGWALGYFHKRLAGLQTDRMKVSLPGFHNLEQYIQQYDQISKNKSCYNSPEVQFCTEAIKDIRNDALLLEKIIHKNKITPTLVHGDPKIANILFDKDTNLAISLIDLDTVGPGFPQHDIGDCLRSVCNRSGEKSKVDKVSFDLNLCQQALDGYFRASDRFLTTNDSALIYDGLKAITYELGLRFFTDYLQGGIYFKCDKAEDILKKSLVQFTLLRDIIAKQEPILKLIRRYNQAY
ncbi:MAG: aminoglycoside phosphotransferase family protein [Desulfocapsa sp.]|nr:aminoglycoside phosphotransferase family protein [Desulfocapsa sp.]